MLDHAGLAHEYDLLADVGRHVTDPLEVLGDERQPQRAGDGAGVLDHMGKEDADGVIYGRMR